MVEEKDKKVKELQDNIAAMNFTPQSKMGKMLMAKCRTLQEENEEIGNQAAEGKVLLLFFLYFACFFAPSACVHFVLAPSLVFGSFWKGSAFRA